MVPQIGTKIEIKGTIHSEFELQKICHAILFGEIKDVILPETTISDLCSNFKPSELGFLYDSSLCAAAYISQILHGCIDLGFPCTRYVINAKALLPLDDDFYACPEPCFYFSFLLNARLELNFDEDEWEAFINNVLKARSNCKGMCIE